MENKIISLISLLLVATNSVRTSPTPKDGSDIYNPLSDLIEMPPACKGRDYCFEKGANYPEEEIEELLQDMSDFLETRQSTSVGTRKGNSYDEPDCPSNSTESPIYYIRDTTGNVRVVVQSPEKFQQIYTVKQCLNEGRIEKDTPHFLKNTTLQKFKIECVSTKMNFDFFVLRFGEDVKMEKAWATIPVCCRCRYDADNF